MILRTPDLLSDMTEISLSDAVELQTPPAKHNANAETQVDAEMPQHTIEVIPTMSKADLLRVLTAGYFFFCAGVNDGSIGPLIPYLLQAYDINTNIVSIV